MTAQGILLSRPGIVLLGHNSAQSTNCCDVIVLGAGPAASVVIRRLAQEGLRIIQVVKREKKQRPIEILSPASRHLLCSLGFPEPVGSVPCRGVLSNWGTGSSEFYDYELQTGVSGLAINRSTFHSSLTIAAESDCYLQFFINTAPVGYLAEGGDSWRLCFGNEVIKSEWVVDASGRQSKAPRQLGVSRKNVDALVARVWPCEAADNLDFLIVESARFGWWYMPPPMEQRGQLVYLTDVNDLSEEMLKQERDCSTLIQSKLTSQVRFDKTVGVNARFSCVTTPIKNKWVAVGDAALSLDPLSGTGIWHAINGGVEAAKEILFGTNSYQSWIQATFEQEKAIRESVYSSADRNHSSFWCKRTTA